MATVAPETPGSGDALRSTATPDADLVAGVRAGRHAAFEEVYELYRAPIYNLALRIVQTPEDARDITQDVFVKAFRQLPGGDAELSLKPWLYRVAVNACYDHLRTRKIHGDIDALDTASRAVYIDTFEQAEMSRQLEQTLAGLSERHRTVLVLKDIHGLRHDEIATILGVSRGATETLLFRARHSFRARYTELTRERPVGGCTVAQEAAVAAVAGTLTADERRRVMEHAAHCGDCGETVKTWSVATFGLGMALHAAPLPAALQGSFPFGLAGAGATAGAGASGAGSAAGGGVGGGAGAAAGTAAGAGAAGGGSAGLTLVTGGLVAKLGGIAAVKIAAVAVAASCAVTAGGVAAYESTAASHRHTRPDSAAAAVNADSGGQTESTGVAVAVRGGKSAAEIHGKAFGHDKGGKSTNGKGAGKSAAAHAKDKGNNGRDGAGKDKDKSGGNGKSKNATTKTKPDKPAKPATPDKPDKPTTPDKPDKPDTPDKPDKPDKPTTPDKPDKPDPPDKPDKPDKPD